MLNWRRSVKAGVASAALTAFALGGSYGIADAAVPAVFHGHGHHFPGALYGSVTGVQAGSFTLDVRHDHSLEVLTTSATKYRESGSPTPVTGVTVGEHVIVYLVRHHHAPPVTTTTAPTTTAPTTTAPTTTVDPISPSVQTRTTAASTTDPTPPTAAVVDILLARESGRVGNFSATTITLGSRAGHTRTVDISTATAYFEGGKSVTQSALAKGDFITAYGTLTTGGVLDAVNVDIYPVPSKTPAGQTGAVKLSSAIKGKDNRNWSVDRTPKTGGYSTTQSAPNQQAARATVDGVVKSVIGNVIVVRTFGGSPQKVTVTATTAYRNNAGQTTLAAVATGDPIRAYGTETAGGALTASLVVIGSPATASQPNAWSYPQPAYQRPAPGGAPSSSVWPASHNSNRSPHPRHH